MNPPLTSNLFRRLLPLGLAATLLTGCTQTMSDEASCREMAKSINIINGFLASSTGDPTEATSVFAQVAKSFEEVSKQTQGDRSKWALTMAESAADASLSIAIQDSATLTSSIEDLLAGMELEASYCPAN